ncbi:D-arabinose 1-dehydrogenase [Fusarium oxysporum f. sp. cubense]|uniref:D-arabinose 1-dehydrogenase n=1 Tax=Fusarium oxysporum f. sp. cubense TaxID=61366 RepID=A0A559LU35_FUSOC|nr:D-arabinose 1-dehydrogenase [Fusarium oxysporum f. sp. cubense]
MSPTSSPPALVMGGAGFSYQLNPEPESLPIVDILLRSFELGVRTIDTSPYYEPSEQLMGAALSDPRIQSRYQRSDFELMTKVGRIKENEFNYSPDWIRKSVARSLERFGTTYLDVVFCHDVEYVSLDEAVTAVGVLLEFQQAGVILRVGISGYDIDVLAEVASLARKKYGHPVDVVQTWAQLTLQNTQAETRGFDRFRAAGVNSVFCSSPLAVGLLRTGGIPLGLTGDWHPAPQGLRAAAAEAAEWMDKHGDGETLCSLAMQYAIVKAKQNCTPSFSVSTITGISTLSDLEQNVVAAKRVLKTVGNSESLLDYTELDSQSVESRLSLAERVRLIIGEWLDYDFSGKKPKTVNSGSNGDDIKEPGAVDITAPKHKELKQPAAIRVMV